jgi:hypothetical protein
MRPTFFYLLFAQLPLFTKEANHNSKNLWLFWEEKFTKYFLSLFRWYEQIMNVKSQHHVLNKRSRWMHSVQHNILIKSRWCINAIKCKLNFFIQCYKDYIKFQLRTHLNIPPNNRHCIYHCTPCNPFSAINFQFLPGNTSRNSWFGTWIQPFRCWIIHWNIFALDTQFFAL